VADGNQQAALLDDAALEASAVVANCAMNRERQLAGVNSYARELGFNPFGLLTSVIAGGSEGETGTAAWLDLCCGTGRALIQCARQLDQAGFSGQAVLTGIDLAGAFDPVPHPVPGLELVCAPLAAWVPGRRYDLITCVHGLHYIGDKLGLLTRAAGWLTETGCLVADLDLSAIALTGGPPAMRRLTARLRAGGFAYSARRHQITRTGHRDIHLPYTYLGANDRAGPGYTGQPAVSSHYSEITPQPSSASNHPIPPPRTRGLDSPAPDHGTDAAARTRRRHKAH
jgi:SAM-dependent methyltransferase